MLKHIVFAVALAVAGLAQSLPARAAEAEVYYFGAKGCDYCAKGLDFLKRLEREDTGIRLRDYDIIASPSDSALFVFVVRAIGLADPHVPMTVIGHNVIIGYESDETTGREIRLTIQQCRTKACPNILGDLLGLNPEMAEAVRGKFRIEQRFAKATERR
jgi:glutaredoxin